VVRGSAALLGLLLAQAYVLLAPELPVIGDVDTSILVASAVGSAFVFLCIACVTPVSDVPPLPIPADTANVRSGPEVNPACLSLLPLVGVWRGTGLFGNDPDAKDPQFGQQITIAHDGRPFLTYESVSWLLGPDGAVTGPGAREVGFWRPQADGSVELMVAHSEGRIELFYGRSRSVASWALSTDAVVRTPTAIPVVGATRLYGITPDGRLAYVEERAHTDSELAPHASAALERLIG
jgi:hypothetical protein